jgi:hypothetical protein
MAVNTRVGASTRNRMLDTINTEIGASALLPDTALGAQVLLAELTFNSTPFGAASAGVITANAITSDSSANATGTASWASIVTSGGTRKIDCSVGTSSANVILNTTSIVSGATVSCSACTITMPMQGA